MLKQTRLALLLIIFCLVLAFHLSIAWQDFHVLTKNGFLYDDSFYAFQIAKHISSGHGATFDGIHLTNGFQPLYVFLLVPLFFLFGSSLTLPIKLALTMSAIATAMTAVLLYMIVKRYVRDSIALLVSFVWALSPVAIKQGANGLETSLTVLLFALAVYFYLVKIRDTVSPPKKDFFILGLVLGLAILSRIDQVFLLFAILLDYLFLAKNKMAPAKAGAYVAMIIMGVTLLYTPWASYNYATIGTPIQDSGTATRYLSVAYAPLFDLGSPGHGVSGPGSTFLLFNLKHAVNVLKLAPPTHVVYRSLEKIGFTLGGTSVLYFLGTLAGFAMLGYILYTFSASRKPGPIANRREINFLLVFSLSIIASYSFYVFGFFFFTRYFYPIYFVCCLYFAFFLEDMTHRLTMLRFSWVRRLVFAAFAIYLTLFGYMSYSQAFQSSQVYSFYDVAEWIRQNTDENETIGVFQGGMVGYFSGRQVVNLDGKVNREALSALKEGTLLKYLEREGIDVVVDNSKVLCLFLLGPNGEYDDENCVQIMHGKTDGIAGWSAYRFKHSRGGMSSAAPAASAY